MTEILTCWKCGADLVDVPLPLSRLAECPQCHADLHVCRMCLFFDPSAGQQCREPIAEAVADKTRANFCALLQANPQAYRPAEQNAADAARAQLEALFGGTPAPSEPSHDAARAELEKLFAKPAAKKPGDH